MERRGQSSSKDPGEDILREILYPLLKKSTKLQSAMEIYDLADEDTAQHTYQFLHRALSKHVEKERENRNRIAIVNAMNRNAGYKPKTAMPAQIERDSGGVTVDRWYCCPC